MKHRIDPFSPAERSWIMSLIKAKDSTPELAVRRLVHRLGYRFRLHQKELPGTPDLVFPSRMKVIFVSGCFWHMHTCGACRIPTARRDYWVEKLNRNRRRDRRVRQQLKQMGWQSLTIWECQVKDAKAVARKVIRFLDEE